VLEALAPLSIHFIVVDDGSDAANVQILDQLVRERGSGLTLMRHPVNQGKGSAVINGMREAARLGFTHALQIDSDGQHDSAALPALLKVSRENPDALVSGCPVYDKSAPFSRRYGRLITQAWVYLETLSFQLKDTMCGLRIYPLASTLALLDKKQIGLGMDFDVEIMVRLFWEKVPVRFVPVHVTYPEGGLSHFHPVRDNLRISWMHTKLVCSMFPHWFGISGRAAEPFSGFCACEQKKEASETHWAQTAERRGLWGMRFLFFTHRVLGRRVFLLSLYPVIAVFWLTGGRARRASGGYLRRLRDRATALNVPLPEHLNSFRHFVRFGEAIHEKIAAWRGEIPPSNVQIIQSPEVIELLKKGGSGVIFGGHLGNFELCRAFGAFEGRVVNAIVFTKHAERFNQLLRDVAPGSQFNLISAAVLGPATAVLLQEKIANGEWVAITADRTSVNNPERTVTAEFLGAPARFPQGPFLLAAALKCPVLLMFGIREADGLKIHIELFADPLEINRTTRAGDIAREAQRFAGKLEQYCLRAPLDWFNFYDFWEKGKE
jgi:predicted LPLAT superfamily acyltransferase